MSPIKIFAALVLFSLTLAFSLGGIITAVYGIRHMAPVLGNAALFLLAAVVAGGLFLALARNLTRSDAIPADTSLEELFDAA